MLHASLLKLQLGCFAAQGSCVNRRVPFGEPHPMGPLQLAPYPTTILVSFVHSSRACGFVSKGRHCSVVAVEKRKSASIATPSITPNTTAGCAILQHATCNMHHLFRELVDGEHVLVFQLDSVLVSPPPHRCWRGPQMLQGATFSQETQRFLDCFCAFVA